MARDAQATHGAAISTPDSRALRADRICPIRHEFASHPLMQLPALAALARRLMPQGQCRFIDPSTTQTSAFIHHPRTRDGQAIDEFFATIERPGAWIALYDVQTDPAYAGFIDQVLASATALRQPGLFRAAGFIFISAPPSVTPFHIDRENNFWLQIRGRKIMTVFDPNDQQVVANKAREDFIIDGSLEQVRLDPALRSHGRDFDVGPGDGVYFPSTSAHMTRTTTDWVRPGDGVSVSIGVVFYTATTRRHARVHQCNRQLRKLGVSPLAPGLSPWRDALKAPIGWAVAATRARWLGYKAPPGAF